MAIDLTWIGMMRVAVSEIGEVDYSNTQQVCNSSCYTAKQQADWNNSPASDRRIKSLLTFAKTAPCALLRFIKEREPCLESEKKGQAIERMVPRAFARTTRKW
ncbi:hypothetical protein Ccrd_022990 [Cynara cardunculus var. scolymus]|uniref:Uncharacterized protein n=1 Tax=Cynara cardunculus var. scolymus TaxID=59895 RepID=A0A118JZ25_CYNCS|nr:hypothetical protein Ccrd_022990 [Cynara cardunculus var. scolymus]